MATRLRCLSGVLCLLLSFVIVEAGISAADYDRLPFCNTTEHIQDGCMVVQPKPVRSVNECARRCATTPNCLGFSVNATNEPMTCNFHYFCYDLIPAQFVCPIEEDIDTDLMFFAKYIRILDCQNGGTFILNEGRCICIDSWIGEECTERGRTCKDLVDAGYEADTRQYYLLQPPGFPQPFGLGCALRKGFIRNYIGVNVGEFDFTATWDDYVNGIYPNETNPTEYWIGLNAIHYFNTRGMTTLRIAFDFTNPVYGAFIEYRGVHIGGPETNYAFSYGREIVKFDDVTATEVGCIAETGFSTPDVDNDLDPDRHCASLTQTGWWFGTCNPNPMCNPLGRGFGDNDDPGLQHMYANTVNLNGPSDRMVLARMYLDENYP